MERRRIPKEYYRDSKSEEIERMIRRDPHYKDWIVMRFRSSGGLSDYEDMLEIQNAKGKSVTELSESEVDLLISSGTLFFVLENCQRMGFFRRFGSRTPYVILLVLFAGMIFAFVVGTVFFEYIRTLPAEQGLLGFILFFAVLFCFAGILCFSQRNNHRREQEADFARSKQEPISDELLDDILDKTEKLADLKQNDPSEYIHRLRELADD